MSLLFRDRPTIARDNVRLPFNLNAYMPGWRGSSGIAVDTNTAMSHPTFWSCVTKISQDVSMMPADVVRYSNGERQAVDPTPQIIAAPSVFHKALDWRYQIVQDWLTEGDTWGLITSTTADMRYPTRIELQSSASIRVQVEGKKLCFYVDNVEHELWPTGDLWHVAAYTVAGSILGLSPVEKHRATVGKGLAAEKYGLQYFTDGAHPTGIWKLPGTPDKTTTDGFKQRLLSIVSGNREDIITGTDTEYQQVQTNPSDSQFLQTEEWAGVQICSIFGEDPVDHGLSAGGSVTYANRSDADLARFKRRQFWVAKLQDTLTDLLPRPQVVRLNASVALMMTARERHELHDLRLRNKTTSINQVHKIEDEPPVRDPQYDDPGIPGVVLASPTAVLKGAP